MDFETKEIHQVPIEQITTVDLSSNQSSKEIFEDDLKSSILNSGLNQPLVLAKGPTNNGYLLLSGGNTRLKVLQQIHQESNGKQFAQIPALIYTWPGEIQSRLERSITDDVSQQFTFLEQSQLVIQFTREYLSNGTTPDLNHQEIATKLTQCGYPISKRMIDLMVYAVDQLYPVIPKTLESGSGIAEIDKVRTLEIERQERSLAQGLELQQFLAIFRDIATTWDGDHWNFDLFKADLDKELVVATQSLSIVNEEQNIANGEPKSTENTERDVEEPRPNEMVDQFTELFRVELRKKNYQLAKTLAKQFGLEQFVYFKKSHRMGFGLKQLADKTLTLKMARFWQFMRVCIESTTPTVRDTSEEDPACEVDRQNCEIDLELLFDLDTKHVDVLMELWGRTRELQRDIPRRVSNLCT
ncbi:MAG: hypothetical protein F4166_09985 [Gammaproteobacteria bacterium]|nr:hypothetical protein [Gammaproteobacteria bacterium]MYF54118.1 hypothetical protein [Gammaproteobacteria bacterium]